MYKSEFNETINKLDIERHTCNDLQIWNNKKLLKKVWYITFNCVFGCHLKGDKDTPERLEACKDCYSLKKPNMLNSDTVRKEFICDNVNIFSSKKLALESIEIK
jgi:hypothetical protein